MGKEMGILLGTLLVLVLIMMVIVMIGRRVSGKLSIRRKNWWLVFHLASVIIYFGGLLGTLLLAVSTTYTTDGDLIYAAHLYIQYFDWFLIIPGAFGSLITGLWLAVRTHWGFAKYYWVIAKWVGNMTAILFGGGFMRVWIHDNFHHIFSGSVHPLQNPAYLQNREMLFLGTAVSFTILIFLAVISVFKPWRKRREGADLSV